MWYATAELRYESGGRFGIKVLTGQLLTSLYTREPLSAMPQDNSRIGLTPNVVARTRSGEGDLLPRSYNRTGRGVRYRKIAVIEAYYWRDKVITHYGAVISSAPTIWSEKRKA